MALPLPDGCVLDYVEAHFAASAALRRWRVDYLPADYGFSYCAFVAVIMGYNILVLTFALRDVRSTTVPLMAVFCPHSVKSFESLCAGYKSAFL